MLELSTLTSLLAHWGYLGIFGGIVVGGEILLLVAGALSSLGYFNILIVIIFATIPVVGLDMIWYSLGRMGRKLPFLKKIGKKIINPEDYLKVTKFFNKHPLKTIFFIRIIYGLRGIIIMLAGATGVKVSYFLFVNFLGTLFWAVAFTLTGYFFSQSLVFFYKFIQNITLFISLATVSIFVLIFLIILFKKRLMKEIEQ